MTIAVMLTMYKQDSVLTKLTGVLEYLEKI